MNISVKIFSLCLGMTLLSSTCIASYNTVFFQLRHIGAGPDLRTPDVGSVEMRMHIYKKNGAYDVWIDHLLLGKMYQDHIKEWPIFLTDLTGEYNLSVTCFGKDQFATQTTHIDKPFHLNRGTHEIDISYSCPMNQAGTVLTAPEEMLFVQK